MHAAASGSTASSHHCLESRAFSQFFRLLSEVHFVVSNYHAIHLNVDLEGTDDISPEKFLRKTIQVVRIPEGPDADAIEKTEELDSAIESDRQIILENLFSSEDSHCDSVLTALLLHLPLHFQELQNLETDIDRELRDFGLLDGGCSESYLRRVGRFKLKLFEERAGRIMEVVLGRLVHLAQGESQSEPIPVEVTYSLPSGTSVVFPSGVEVQTENICGGKDMVVRICKHSDAEDSFGLEKRSPQGETW